VKAFSASNAQRWMLNHLNWTFGVERWTLGVCLSLKIPVIALGDQFLLIVVTGSSRPFDNS
jgi:hypothetical protein